MKIHLGTESYSRNKDRNEQGIFNPSKLFLTEANIKSQPLIAKNIMPDDNSDDKNCKLQMTLDEKMWKAEEKQKQLLQSKLQKIKRKSWEKSLELIRFEPPTFNYYDQFPVKPGIYFIKALVCSDVPLNTLKFNIPHTVGLFEEKFYLFTHPSKGHLVYRNKFRDAEFISICEQQVKNPLNKTKEAPFLVRKSDDFFNVEKQAISYADRTESLSKFEAETIVQQYIHPVGGKASFLRFLYHNPRSYSNKQNHAVLVCHNSRVLDNLETENLQQRAFINYDRVGTFEAFVQKQQQSFTYFEQVAQSLIEFILRAYKLKLSKIVIDFVKDDNYGQNWVLGVKFFEVDFRSPVYMKVPEGEDDAGDQNKNKDSARNLQKQMHQDSQLIVICQLCRQTYERSEIKRIVSHKMIIDLKNHLNKRGIFMLEKINPQLMNDLCINHQKWRVNSCKVCDLCYQIIVAEQDLFDIEKQFAIAQSIPIVNDNDISEFAKQQKLLDEHLHSVNVGKEKFSSSNFKEKLIQWRILIQLNTLFDLELKDLLKENSIKDKFYIQIKIFGYITAFEINIDKFTRMSCIDPEIGTATQIIELSKLDLNKMRVHYFFTENTMLDHFLSEVEIEYRLTIGQSWSKKMIAQGLGNPFQYLNKGDFTRVQTQSFQAHLFSTKVPKFYINGIIGLKMDLNIQTENVDLYLQHGVYVPDNSYFNCDPFPIEWLEIIDKRHILSYYTDNEALNDHPIKKLFKVFNPVATKLDDFKKLQTKLLQDINSNPLEKKVSQKRPQSCIRTYRNNTSNQNDTSQNKLQNLNPLSNHLDALFNKSQNQSNFLKDRPQSSYYLQAQKPTENKVPNHSSYSNLYFSKAKDYNSNNNYNRESSDSSQIRNISTDLDAIINDKLTERQHTSRNYYALGGNTSKNHQGTGSSLQNLTISDSTRNQYITMKNHNKHGESPYFSVMDKPMHEVEKPMSLKRIIKQMNIEDQRYDPLQINRKKKLKKSQSCRKIVNQPFQEYKEDFKKMMNVISGKPAVIEKKNLKKSKSRRKIKIVRMKESSQLQEEKLLENLSDDNIL